MPELLEDIPIALKQRIWFMHDGIPSRLSTFLNEQFSNIWLEEELNSNINLGRLDDQTWIQFTFFFGSISER